MTAQPFINRIRSLWNLDKADVPFLSDEQWPRFRGDPTGFLMRCDDATADSIVAAVEARQKKPAQPPSGLIVQPVGNFVYVAKPDGKKVASVLGTQAEKYDLAYQFAASGEMLAALKLALPHVTAAAADRIAGAQKSFEAARAAIAKAEGRQP